MKNKSYLLSSITIFGFAFLYIPIISMIIFSFNESKLVTVWGGFSLKWYGELFKNEQLLTAAWVSLKIAFITATLAVFLGTLAGFSLAKFRRFRGRLVLIGLITAPLVMPDVIIGLSLLLLFVSMEGMFGWPSGRGVDTIIIAHATFCMAYVAIIVQGRLSDLDKSIEEAAMDLGATPLKTFIYITLPIIFPALLSGWLLAFTLSLDDLVIASFVSGPGSSTLPMVIFSKVRLGVSPEINVLATFFVAIVALCVLAFGWYSSSKKRLEKSSY